MCPVCLTTAALIAGSVSSTGGLAAVVIKKFGGETAGKKRRRQKSPLQPHPRRMTMSSSMIEVRQPKTVSHPEWLAGPRAFLAKEKEFTRLRDELSHQRRALPWESVEKRYEFDSANGKVALADLFNGRSQLIVYHFMFGPDWQEGCPSCSFVSDHFDGTLVHLRIATPRSQ